jgi:hypothetical protein
MEWLCRYVIDNNMKYTVIFDRHESIRNIFRRIDKGLCEKKYETKHQENLTVII